MSKFNSIAAGASLLAMLSSTVAMADAMGDLTAAAKKEGALTTIALPHGWCGYGAVLEGFKKKYPEIAVNELNPDGSSATRWKPCAPTRATPGRKRLTFWTSACRSARSPRKRV